MAQFLRLRNVNTTLSTRHVGSAALKHPLRRSHTARCRRPSHTQHFAGPRHLLATRTACRQRSSLQRVTGGVQRSFTTSAQPVSLLATRHCPKVRTADTCCVRRLSVQQICPMGALHQLWRLLSQRRLAPGCSKARSM